MNTTTKAPVWQSHALLAAGLAALAAAELGAAAYAFQSASASQEVMGVPTDALIKTALSITAGLGVAFGAIVTGHLWRTGRKGLRRQAYLGIAVTLVAFCVSVSNLSGYFAWTRAQHEAEMIRESGAYLAASSLIARQEAGEALYVSSEERATLRNGEAPADADRALGDMGKAAFVHLLIMGMGAAYRIPVPAKRRKTVKRRQPVARVTKLTAVK